MSMGDSVTGKDLERYILSLPKQERIDILQKNNIRDKFLESENHYPFVWLVQSLEPDELKYFIDNDYLDKIILDDRASDKFNAIMTSGNKKVSDILTYDRAIAFILDKTNNLTTHLSGLDYQIGQAIIDFNISHNTNQFSCIGNLRKEEQLKVFNNEYIVKLLKKDNLDRMLLINLDGKVINKLIKYDKFLEIFMNLSAYEINTLVKYKNFIIPKHLINNKKLIEKFVVSDSDRYRFYINNLLINNYEFARVLENERLKHINNKINSMDNGILDKYQDYEKYEMSDLFMKFGYKKAFYLSSLYEKKDYDSIAKELQKLSEKELFELIVDFFFKDSVYNFLVNLKSILNYKEENQKYQIKNLDLYLKIMNFHSLSLEEKKTLFNDYKDIDLATTFYEDYRKARNLSYEQINDNLLKLDKKNRIYDEELSKKYNRDVYYLNGEEFYLYIHSSKYGNWMNNKKTLSLSLISHDNISHFYNGKEEIIFGFSSLNIENIMHVSNSDSYTSHEYGTDKIQRINSPKKLMEETIGYNEILYSEYNLENFKPDFIVAFDFITDGQYEVAQEMNLSIVVINSEKYIKKSGLERIDKNKYVNLGSGEEVEYDILNEEDINVHSK